jgi:hypothetical protein
MSAKAKEEKVLPKRFIVTFREGSLKKGMASVNNFMGVKMSNMMCSADFDDNAINMTEASRSGGVVFNNLGIGVFCADEDQARKTDGRNDSESAHHRNRTEGIGMHWV